MTPTNRSMTRRTFMRTSSAVAALFATGATLSAVSAVGAARKYKMGLQLYTVRDPMAQDALGTLKRIAKLGYRDLETYGFEPGPVKLYGMPARTLRTALQDLGLTTTSGHYDLGNYLNAPLADYTTYVDRCIEAAVALDQKYVTWPWLDPQSRSIESFKKVAERLNVLGERTRKAGIGAAYHNHEFEFADQGGVNGFDIISTETDAALVKLQMDLFWVAHSSPRSPTELIKAQPGRFVMWHIKDMDTQKRYTELGKGTIDFRPIMPHAELAGLEYYYVEQGSNFAVDPMSSIETSAAYVRQHLGEWTL